MKKLFSLLLALCASLSLWANGTEINGIYYILAGDSAEVTYTGTYYYSNNSYAGAITIPSSVTYSDTTYRVTSIGNEAFYYCTGLTSITIPSSVISIGEEAFEKCTGLTSIIIPSTVKGIGRQAFSGCTGLTSVTIGNSVTSIGSYAFYRCTGLTSITCEAVTPPTCGSNCFDNVDKSIPLYVPAGSVSLYQVANRWKDFTNILPISASSTVLPSNAITTTVGNNNVTISWPSNSYADTYTIVISKSGTVFCTLNFNAQGQLMNIAFATPARGGIASEEQAVQTVNGFMYTVSGLDSGTDYSYVVTTSASGSVFATYSGTFRTNNPSGVEETSDSNSASTKFMRNGRVLIRRANNLFDLNGKQL